MVTELSLDEESALVDHLRIAPGRMEQHIRDGGSWDEYVARWQAERNEAARRKLPSPELVAQVLDCSMADGYGDPDGTVRDYLVKLLAAFWAGEADAKYGIEGSSDWRYQIYGPLNRAGIIPGWRQGYGIGYRPDGTVDRNDEKRANALIIAAIRTLGTTNG